MDLHQTVDSYYSQHLIEYLSRYTVSYIKVYENGVAKKRESIILVISDK
jgi:hypothetical protein